MAFTERLIQPNATQETLMSGGALQNLLNNALVSGSAFNNLSGTAGFDGAPSGWLTLKYKLQSCASAGQSISVWMLGAADLGANSAYEDGGTSYTPDRAPDAIFPVAIDTNEHQCQVPVFLKVGYQMPLLKNQTGQSFANDSTSNVLYLSAEERQLS